MYLNTPPEISLNANKFLDFETDLGGVFKYISPGYKSTDFGQDSKL